MKNYDGLACVLVAFLSVIILIGIFTFFVGSQSIYMGRVVSIDYELTGNGLPRYFAELDTGESQVSSRQLFINQKLYKKVPYIRLGWWK